MMLKKLRSRRGESLAETLCAVLVAGLAVSLLAGMVGAATRMASKANTAADSLYEAVSKAEKQDDGSKFTASKSTVTVKVTVGTDTTTDNEDVTVNFYGDADEVLSYAKTPTTEGGGS